MKIIFNLIIASFLAALPCNQIQAQTPVLDSRDIEQLQLTEPVVKVIKREVVPGIVTFNRNHGCTLQNPISTNFLDNGVILRTPVQLTVTGNTLPQWRNEYRKSWRSELTDYEGGEYKIMLLQIGQHPPTLIELEESQQQLIEAQTLCAVATSRIFGSNLKLLREHPPQKCDRFCLSLVKDWERFFAD